MPDRHRVYRRAAGYLARSVPGLDQTVGLQDLRLQLPQLGAERGDTRAGELGYPFVTCIGDDPSSSSTPLRPTGATIPNSARWARMALITAVCWRINRWRWSDAASGNSVARVSWSPRSACSVW